MADPSRLPHTAEPPKLARFGVYELDLRTAELRRNGIKIRLQEQPFRLLVLLLEKAGDVVTREEIRDRLWPAEFVDFDHGLNTAVRKLREALDDSAENPRFIETLARRGYRFIAPISWATNGAHVARTRKTPWIAGALAMLLAIAGLTVWLSRNRTAAKPNAIAAIAVLPFTNEDPQTAHLSDGLTEILIDSLSRLPDMRVMARTTVFGYKGKDPRDAGRELNVGAVVVGNLRRDGDRYTIHIELLDVADGSQLWGDQFAATAATFSTIETRISSELSNQLRQGVDRDRRKLAAHRYTNDPKAYDLYLWGLYAWNKRTKADLLRAEEYFKGAIARDPNFAAAYAGLSQTYGVMVGYGTLPVSVGVPRVIEAAQLALQLDPNNAEALVSLATTKYRSLWDFAGADADYRRALALNPNYATGHQWYADLLRSMGRWDEARKQIQLAYRLDPLSPPINAMMCYSLYYERRYREAIDFSRRAGQLDPTFAAPGCVISSYLSLGDINATVAVLRTTPSQQRECDELLDAYRRSGTRDFFRKSAELMKKKTDVDKQVTIAGAYARMGDRDQAFLWLEKAYDRRTSLLTNVNIDPTFEALHSDPRYDLLLRRIGLPRVEPPATN